MKVEWSITLNHEQGVILIEHEEVQTSIAPTNNALDYEEVAAIINKGSQDELEEPVNYESQIVFNKEHVPTF